MAMHARSKTAPTLVAALCALALAGSQAEELKLKTIEKAPPEAVAPAIRETLSSQAIQLLKGDRPALEFWLRSPLPLRKAPTDSQSALKAVAEATLLGVVSVPNDRRDYRDDELYSGVHTMRFALQPQDGNHLGTSEYLYYAVLVPAEKDTSLKGIRDYDGLVDASSEETASQHPMILSLRPAPDSGDPRPSIQEPKEDHKALRLRVDTRHSGAQKAEPNATIVFDLVFEGIGEL